MRTKKLLIGLFAIGILAMIGCGSGQEQGPQKTLPGDYSGPPGGAAAAGPSGTASADGSPAPPQRAPQ